VEGASVSGLRLVLAAIAVAGGFLSAVLASRRAVANTVELAAGTRIPRFVIGFTLLAVGTDLPEIANSIASSVTGHGDLNVGDSVGSTATQVTLVLGLLPIIAAASFAISRRRFVRVGALTVVALLLGAALMLDGHVSRTDALILLAMWAVGSVLTFSRAPQGTQLDLPLAARGKLAKVGVVLVALAVVGVGALSAVWGMTVLAEAMSVPEYVIAFFGASIGTSLPELIVEFTAVRQGQSELAIGDALGSSFVDATLSIGAGPLIAPVAVTSSLVVRGSLTAAGAVVMVVALLAARRRHDWVTGLVLVLIYLAFYFLLV
jgi:cation:H+ antiporter